MKLRREHRLLATTAALALGLPATAAWWVHARTAELADHLAARGGVGARIGNIDADLTGTITVSDVALGELFSADSIEASVALDSLLAGHVAADEIRVAGPHIAVAIDRDGDSDLARLVRRFVVMRKGSVSAAKVRRVVVSSGTLIARIAGVGEIAADQVELVPDAGGVRVITGKLHVRAGNALIHSEIELARSAAELALPTLTFGRVLAVGGTGVLHIGERAIALSDIAVGRLATRGKLEAHGLLDDAGAPRAVAAELVPPSPDRPGFMLAVSGSRVPLAPFASLAPRWLGLADARVSGRLSVSRADTTVLLAVDASFTQLRFAHRALAAKPITLDTTLAAAVALGPDAIAVEHATLAVGAGHWTAAGWWRRGTPSSGQLDLQLAPAPCMELFASLPEEVRAPLEGMALTGTFGGSAHLAVDLAAPLGKGVELGAEIANHCEVTTEPAGADVTALAGNKSTGWVELHKLPDHVAGAFVSAEDGRFYEHAGFDLYQIARSFEIDLRDRRLARGGSTISQQLVKNELLTQRRSLDRKIQEAVLTWRLESRLTKKTILEHYLNIIELGPHIRGLGAAASFWFDTRAKDLSIKQASFLAALTSEPQSMSRRVRDAGRLDAESSSRVDTILRAMRRDGVIDKRQLEDARGSSLHFATTALRREI